MSTLVSHKDESLNSDVAQGQHDIVEFDQFDPDPPVAEPISSVRDGSNPWEKCMKLSQKYDDETCEALKGELDNLMLFATLFSAIVTTFAVDSYKWLEPSSASGSTSPVTMSVAIQVNVLWFLSLASSLGVASVGILCTQWVRNYGRQESKPTARSLALRRQRFHGFHTWRVPGIISFLPVLLQLSLVLFGIGLIRFLLALHHAVGIAFMVASVITIAFVLITMLAPVFQWWLLHLPWSWLQTSQCPFQSPQAWICCLMAWWMTAFGRKSKQPGNWRQFDDSWLDLASLPLTLAKPAEGSLTNSTEGRNAYQQKLLCEELVWLDHMFSDDVEGIKARAEALRHLPREAAKYVVRKQLEIRQSQNKDLDLKLFDKICDPADAASKDRPYLYFKHLRAWYLWAHAQVHPGLDDAYMEARIQFMSEIPRKDLILPALPRASHLDVYCLVKTKEDEQDDRIVPRFLLCLKMLVTDQRLTKNNSAEMWTIIGDLIEYSIRHNYTQYFRELASLLVAIQHSMLPLEPTVGETSNTRMPESTKGTTRSAIDIAMRPTIDDTIGHMLKGLDFLFELHADQKIYPLAGKECPDMRHLLDIVVDLKSHASQQKLWKRLEEALRAWTRTPETKPPSDSHSDMTLDTTVNKRASSQSIRARRGGHAGGQNNGASRYDHGGGLSAASSPTHAKQ